MRAADKPYGFFCFCPFVSSCPRTEAANARCCAAVGLIRPANTPLAKLDMSLDDCFFAAGGFGGGFFAIVQPSKCAESC